MPIYEVHSEGRLTYKVIVYVRLSKPAHVKTQRSEAGFKTKLEAKRAEKRLLAEAQNIAHERARRGTSWASLIDDFEIANRQERLAKEAPQTTTISDYVGTLRLYTEHFSQREAISVTRFDIREIIKGMREQGKSQSRIKSLKNAINRMFNWGIEEGKIPPHVPSPAFGIKVQEAKETQPPEILKVDEIKKLLELASHLKHPWQPVWAFALLTGMRSGELFELRWSDIDWEGKKIKVSRSYNNRLNIIKSTKSGIWRDISINADLMRLLQELRSTRGNEDHILPRLPGWERGEAARILRAFCEGYGLPSIKFHTLRSCFATQLIKNKVAPGLVMKVAGWQDLKTMQRYVRLSGIEVDGATDSLRFLPERDIMAQVVPLFTGTTSCGEPLVSRVPEVDDK